MKSRVALPLAFSAFALAASSASAQLLITEIQSDGTFDFWELTNTGKLSVSLANFKWNDSARILTGAVVVPAGAMIAPGESVIFTGTAAETFRTLWGIPSSVKVFTGLSVPGLGQNDGISLYDAANTEVFFLSYALGACRT